MVGAAMSPRALTLLPETSALPASAPEKALSLGELKDRDGALQARTVGVGLVVLAAHAVGLWALHTGLQQRLTPPLEPAVVQVVVMPAPATPEPPTPPSPPPPKPQPRPVAPRPSPAPPPPTSAPRETMPQAPVLGDPAPTSITAAPPLADPTPVSATPPAAPPTASPVTAPPAPPRLEPPSTDARYLDNPRPPYPAMSRRLREQGRVVLRVRIETDGSASQAEVRTSSGFERLDESARQTVLRWRYVPGKRNGVPEAMWFDIPIQFALE